MAFKFKKTGEWGTIKRLAVRFPLEIERINTRTLAEVGLKSESIAVKHLKEQDLSWTPLNKDYLQKKIRKGGSEKILIDTSTYLQAITSTHTRKMAMVGVFRGKATYKDSGEDVVNIAIVHEFGSVARNIPARPLWQPTLNETKSWMRKEDIFVKRIKQFFAKKYGL